ncbi:hypothetical protein [Nocardia sp. XZ_19_385]|uniref:hypothetical protein n=1 Tax=Nocardia sp. XZ_19_385 TaxID=2769488 RepID=UPI00188FDD52|nr:hypothetical protein [Nocardia sp. XZ_19_385]
MFVKLSLAAVTFAVGGLLATPLLAEEPGPVVVHQVSTTTEFVLPPCLPKPVEIEEPALTEPLRPAGVPCHP